MIQKALQSATSSDRKAIVKTFGFPGFKFVYLAHHFALQAAPFHWTMDAALENPDITRLLIIGFRGSAKSTDCSLAYPLYAALELQTPFIIPIADTGTQAAINIANIKTELENNALLVEDYGIKPDITAHIKNPQKSVESEEEWQSKNMLLSNGVRIMARSRGQKVRGLKHKQYRPALILVDDPEDLEWVKSKDNRNKTERWLRGEVLPSLDERTGKLVLIGNYLHDDAIVARAKKWGTFKVLEFPLIDAKTGECTWPEKYPTKEALDAKRKDLGETAWQREMLLKVVAEEGQLVKETDIQRYDALPQINRGARGHGVDLAISEKDTADYTAMVDGDIYYDANDGGRPKIYILANPFHKKCDLMPLEDAMRTRQMTGGGHIFFVEAVGYQKAAINDMERKGLNVQPFTPVSDKRSRLQVVAPYIKNGTILFPQTGCEDLVNEIINFGVEAHDDLCDAFTSLCMAMLEGAMARPFYATMK